jgi:hypothetical protein
MLGWFQGLLTAIRYAIMKPPVHYVKINHKVITGVTVT